MSLLHTLADKDTQDRLKLETKRGISWNPLVMKILLVISIIAMLIPFGLDVYHAVNEPNLSGAYNNYRTYYSDTAELFDVAGKQRVMSSMQVVSAYTNVAVITTNDTNGYTTEDYADRMLYSVLNGKGVVFLIDMYHRQIYLYTDDDNTKLSVSKCYSITDNVYRYASNGNYAECAAQALNQAASVMGDYAIPEPMKHICNLLICFSVSLLVVFIYANAKTKIKKPEEVYQLDKNIRKTVRLDNLVMTLTNTHKVYHNSGSSGGRSGGGGGGFGGGGGGGGHGGGHGF